MASPSEPVAQYDNNMRGVLFPNENKRSPKSPDMTGTETITHTCPHCSKEDQVEYRLAGWSQRSRKGVRYLSLSVTKAEDQVVSTDQDQPEVQDDLPF